MAYRHRVVVRIGIVPLIAIASVVLLQSLGNAAVAQWGPAQAITAPSGARSSSPTAYFNAVSCSATTSCTAVGSYITSSNDNSIFASTELVGVWSQGTAITPPLDASAQSAQQPGPPNLTALSCPETGDCTSVGYYRNDSNLGQGGSGQILPMEVTETSGVWGQAQAVGLPGGANPTQEAQFTSVSCLTVGNCVAVGLYSNVSAMAAIESDGAWNAATSIPGITGEIGQISVSCADDVCTVLAGDNAITESGGTWSSVVPLTASSSVILGGFSSLSCVDASNCAAIGTYGEVEMAGTATSAYEAITETAGTWSAAIQPLGLAYTTDSPGVSCAEDTVTVCQFVAGYQSISESSGTWGNEVSFPIPADDLCGGECSNDGYLGVSCSNTTSCGVVGGYFTSVAELPIVSESPSSDPTTTTASASTRSSTVGQSITYSATITSSGSPPDIGTVDFSDGGSTLCAYVAVSAGSASCTTTATPVGTNTITASYSGNSIFSASSGTTLVVVAPIPDTTATHHPHHLPRTAIGLLARTAGYSPSVLPPFTVRRGA